MKHKKKDLIQILNNLKTISKGIDSLGNKCVNYFNDQKYFVNMRQGRLEEDDSYIKKEILAIETLMLSRWNHVLCSPDITEASDQAKPSEKETTS